MPGEDEIITIRRLPRGPARPGHMISRGVDRLILTPDSEDETLDTGALLEVQSEHTIYLGQVVGRQGRSVILAVEHFADRAALAEIGKAWSTAVP